MKRIKAEDLPEVLSAEDINILAEMANEIPQSDEWRKMFKLLSHEQFREIMDRKVELQKESEKDRTDTMSVKEKKEEAVKWNTIKKNPDPHKFYGNMGQPETPQEFKKRYGVWPPGYEENGNKKD